MPRYSFEELSCPNEWRRLSARAATFHMTQAWAFGEAKRAMRWRPRRLVIQRAGESVAICQLLQRTVFGLPLITRINLGPILIDGHLDEGADVLRAIRQHWCHCRRGLLLIAPDMPYSDEGLQAILGMGFRARGTFRWASSRLDLTRSPDELRQSLTHKWRNRLHKAEREGLRFIAGNARADAEWMLQRHVEHVAAKGFAGPAPALIRALYRAAPEDFLVLRVEHDGDSVAGMAAFRFGGIAHAYVAWTGLEGRRLNAGNFLFWNAALELKRRGCTRFDLGGHNRAVDFGAFKLGMNGAGYELLGEFACA